MVLISGEAGIGKSRIAAAGQERLQKVAHAGEVLGAPAIGEQAVVTDAVEAAGQPVRRSRYRAEHGPAWP
jgi:hypothetical protein